ncbi:MAG: DUF2269 family protein [Oleiphilus sp.]
MDFVIWKFVHIFAVIIFLGNIATGFYWQYHGERQASHRVLLSTFEGLHRSDQWITNPCIVLIIISGLGMGYSVGFELLMQGWILIAYILMMAAGAAYGLKLVPLHEKIITLLDREEFTDTHWSEYREMKRTWYVWAGFATVVPFIILGLMYFKPATTLFS